MRVHIILFVRYKTYLKEQHTDSQQPTLTICLSKSESYPSGHPKQTTITETIVDDLIVGCSLAMSIVENDNFRHFFVGHRQKICSNLQSNSDETSEGKN